MELPMRMYLRQGKHYDRAIIIRVSVARLSPWMGDFKG